MPLKDMPKGLPFSPQTTLTASVGAAETSILVADSGVFPNAPNYATIGTDENGETIYYISKGAGILSGVTRGIEGAAKAWTKDEIIARNWTFIDHKLLIDNIHILDDEKVPTTRKINNQELTADINITKSDVDLSKIDNTSDKDKPVSDATQIELDKKVDKTIKINGKTLDTDITLNKNDVDLSNVDDTADKDKPISNAAKIELDKKAVTTTYSSALTTAWTDVAPYTQQVDIAGILQTDNPIVDILDPTIETLKEWSKVSKIETFDDHIIATCFEEKPTTAINIQLKVVK